MDRIISKITSARFLISVGISTVLCILALKGDINSEAFIGIAGIIVGYYFNKERAE